MINTQYINLNMIPSGVMPVLYCSQYDVGRPLGFVVNNGSEVVNLDQYMVAIEGTRSDGTGIVEDVNTDGNIGVFLTTATMTNKSDIYDMQLVIRSTDTHRVASIPFMMHVRTAALDENSSVIEEDRSLFQQYTETVMIAIAEIRTNVESEATARSNADSALLERINIEAANRAAEDTTLNDRIDNIIAPGGAPSAAEVTDARLGADGVLYDTLGEAIRTQFDDVYKNLAYTVNLESDTTTGLLVVDGGIGGTVPTSLTATLEPQQSGAGAPSADNIRPFIMFTSLSMLHAGESGGGGSGNPPTTPFFGGTQNCITGEWTLYEYFTSYSGVTDLTGVQWWSDRDIYAPGTNPTVGAFVVYEPTTPYTESGPAWGAEAMYSGINQYKMLAYDSVTQTTAPFALTIETDVANVGDVVDGIAHDVSVLQSDMDQTNYALTTLRNEYDITASTVTVHTTLIENNAEDIAENTADIGDLDDLNTEDNSSLVAAINEIVESGGGGTGLTDAVKQALLACFQKVAWIDEHGQDYYDALHDALYPTVASITAVYDGTGHTVYDTDTLNSLKPYLTVTATYDDSSERIVHDYTLSGTLTAGTSTITVTYQGLTTTFNVTVTHNAARLTAVYTQSGTVYASDTLDSLKSDLVVTYYATTQSAGVVVPSADYTLSGTLVVGTSTITAIYLNTSATFTVTVTFESYITAVYTSGQNPLYEDDNHTLNDLKSNLIVTAYTAENPQGVVLSDNDYTLSGTLNRGNNTITATYNGMTATFIAVIVGVGTTNYSGALSTWWLPSNVGTATYSDGEITMYYAEGDTKYGMSIADNAQTLWSEVEGKKLRHRVTAYSPDWTGEYSSQVPRNMISFMACLYGSKTMTNYERLRFRTPYTDILTHNESVYEYISNCTLSWFNSGSGAVTPNTSYGIGMTDTSTHTIKVTGSETVEVIPSSISAVFNQGSNVIYTSDSLDDLKQFLTVTATYFDNSTLENKNYTLSGTLTAGVSTITVSYQGLTATFTVNVTSAASGYIEAVFTQPSTTIYTDDALDTLKSDLVVTYYTAPGTTGTVLADSAYTLSGTLTEGTSTITVAYGGLWTSVDITGVVDFYNIWEWSSDATGVNALSRMPSCSYEKYVNGVPRGIEYQSNTVQKNYRRSFCVNHGKMPMIDNSGQVTEFYPVPIPNGATKLTATITPNTQQFASYVYRYEGDVNPDGYNYLMVAPSSISWKTGTEVLEFTAGENLFVGFNCRKNASNDHYTSETEPKITIVFE